MRERKRRRGRRDLRRRRWRGSPGANIDAMVEVQLPHDFQKRRNRLQVALFQRNVSAAQGLGQPRDLQAGVVLRRIELPLRQGLADSAANRRRALLRVARDLLNAVAGHEQVEIRLSPLDQCLAEGLPGRALARPFGCLFWFIGHERSRFVDLEALYPAFYSSASNCFREFLRIGGCRRFAAGVHPIAVSRGASTKVRVVWRIWQKKEGRLADGSLKGSAFHAIGTGRRARRSPRTPRAAANSRPSRPPEEAWATVRENL